MKSTHLKMNKRRLLVIISIILVIGIVTIGVLFMNHQERLRKERERIKKATIYLKDNLKFEIHTEVKLLSLVKGKDEEVKILSKDENIDTSTLGEKKIKIQYKVEKDTQEKKFKITVIDTTSPVIECSKELSTTAGSEIDLLKDVKVSDNSMEEIKATVEGNYDFNKEGVYSLKYVAVDSSNNRSEEDFTLTVNKKPVVIPQGTDTTFKTSKGFSGYTKNGVTYIEGVLVANKSYGLPSSYGSGLTSETSNAFNEMKNAAANQGLTLNIISGFRSYSHQNNLYNNYVAKDGKAAADRYSARPGHSEHQTGMAVDINSLYSSFENTEEGKWLKDNSYKYGFILRYPKDGEGITGYMYEPWHFRYVGVDLATKLYNNGSWITLEEYFGIKSEYQS